MDRQQWILDSFFSGILDSNAQYSGFHEQKISWIPETRLPYMRRQVTSFVTVSLSRTSCVSEGG